MVKHFRISLVIALVILSMEAMAVEMEAQIGFGHKCRLGCWNPYTVILKNSDHSNFSGVIAAINGVTEQPNPWQTSFEIAGPSEKRYNGYTMENSSASDDVIKLLIRRGRHLSAKEQTAQCAVQQISPNSILLVAVGSSKSTLNFLDEVPLTKTSAKQRSLSLSSPTGISAALSAPETLPDRPLGYDSVDMLVLSDINPRQMNPKQLTAIKMWVASGGTLVVAGGADYQRLKNEFYRDLLPVDVTGVTALGLSSLGAKFGSSIDTASTVVTSGKLKPGATAMLAQNGVPLISSWTYGLGRVCFLAFDYSAFPLKGWDGQETMWKQLLLSSQFRLPVASPINFFEGTTGTIEGSLTTKPRRAYGDYDSSDNRYLSLSSDLPSIQMPSLPVIFIFLVSYLFFLVPLNYYILTKKKRKELAWLTTPLIIIVFTIGAYGIGYEMKGSKLLLKTVTVVEAGPNTRYASTTTYGALFSPSRRSYDVEINDPYAVVSEPLGRSYSSERPRNRTLNVLAAETTTLPDIPMDMWSMRTFQVESGCDMGGIIDANVKAVPSQRSITGTIKNNTVYDLVDCQLVIDKLIVNIGNIDRGTLQQIDAQLQLMNSSTPVNTNDSSVEYAGKVLGNIIADSIGMAKSPVLIGKIKQPTSKISLKRGRGERQSIDYFIYRIGDGKGGI